HLDHTDEDAFEGTLDDLAAARDVAWQRDHGATGVDVVEALSRQVRVDELLRGFTRRKVSAHSVPLRPTFRHRLHVEIALGAEVSVEASARQSGVFHDVVNRDGGEAAAIEQGLCAPDDSLTSRGVVLRRVGHSWLLVSLP